MNSFDWPQKMQKVQVDFHGRRVAKQSLGSVQPIFIIY